MTANQVVAEVEASVRAGATLRIANYNLHALFLMVKDFEFEKYCRTADIQLIDGWPIMIAARLAGHRISSDCRIGSSDWLQALVTTSNVPAILAVGGTPESSANAAKYFRGLIGDKWDAVDGYEFKHRTGIGEARELKDLIREKNVILVGLGMPEQEKWILRHSDILEGKVVANVGGCIDYFSGEQPLAPRALGRVGLEWLYRLCRNPRRLWRRYTLEPIALMLFITQRSLLRKVLDLRESSL